MKSGPALSRQREITSYMDAQTTTDNCSWERAGSKWCRPVARSSASGVCECGQALGATHAARRAQDLKFFLELTIRSTAALNHEEALLHHARDAVANALWTPGTESGKTLLPSHCGLVLIVSRFLLLTRRRFLPAGGTPRALGAFLG
jgi:hypothetical protein